VSDGFDLAELERRANGHSIFAPSASAMWMACSGSLIANLLAPDNAGIDAAIGTVAHSVAEEWLRTGEEPKHRIGEVVTVEEATETFEITIDREMLGYLEDYVNWCREAPGDHYIEQRVSFEQLTPIPRQGGTADHLALSSGHMTLTDLKYGLGVQVFAKENPQVQIYALGAFYEWDWLYDFRTITVRICQPRLGHFDTWETDRESLLAFAEMVKDRAHAAWQPNAPRTPGPKQCRFCRASTTCTARAKLLDSITDETFADEDVQDIPADAKVTIPSKILFPAPRKLSTEQLARVYKHRGAFTQWFSDIGEELDRRAHDGEAVPGFKLATGRSRNDWFDEEAIPMFLEPELGDDLFKRELLSPNGARKALRAKGYKGKEVEAKLAGLIVRKPGRQTLVPEGDVREGEVNIADASFDDAETDMEM